MSVSRMKKLTVFAHSADTDNLIKKLVSLKCVQLDIAEESELGKILSAASPECDAKVSELNSSLARISEAINTLDKYTHRKKALFAPKLSVDRDKFIEDGYDEKSRFAVRTANDATARQNEIKNNIASLKQSNMSLAPWESYDMPLCESGTASSDIVLGVLPAGSDLNLIGRELYGAGAVAEVICSDSTGIYISLVFFRADGGEVMKVLSQYGFSKLSFASVKLTAREQISANLARISELENELDAISDKLTGLADNITAVEILYDIESTALVAAEQRKKLVSSAECSVFIGWVPEKSEDRISSLLEKFDCAYSLEDPAEEDNPPILLENNGFAKNFEWVLGMYSYPAYGRFDPTFIMSIFYFIIFGIMFADAGYGLLMSAICFAAVNLIHPTEGMKRFLLLFGYCGISCMIFGVLFGSYFGDLPFAIMKNMMGMTDAELPNLALIPGAAPTLALIFDPLQNPVGFLILSLGVGAVHLIAGMAVKFYILCKDGQVLDAFLDIASYWVLFAGFGLLALAPSVGLWVTLGAAVFIVLTHGRKEKNIVKKLMGGLLGLYDLISYASDLLSYSRILALGLAAAVIAQVMNILGTIGGATVGGFIGLVAAFAIGHTLNIVLNVLGTFVHTSRLQYIEFFNKFYEDGGRPFEPAAPSDKYTDN